MARWRYSLSPVTSCFRTIHRCKGSEADAVFLQLTAFCLSLQELLQHPRSCLSCDISSHCTACPSPCPCAGRKGYSSVCLRRIFPPVFPVRGFSASLTT